MSIGLYSHITLLVVAVAQCNPVGFLFISGDPWVCCCWHSSPVLSSSELRRITRSSFKSSSSGTAVLRSECPTSIALPNSWRLPIICQHLTIMIRSLPPRLSSLRGRRTNLVCRLCHLSPQRVSPQERLPTAKVIGVPSG